MKARVHWLTAQPLRKTRLFVFFSRVSANSSGRTKIGMKMTFAKLVKFTGEQHAQNLTTLKSIRNALKARLEAAGLGVRELDVGEVHSLLDALLNPAHAKNKWKAPEVRVRDNLFSDEAIAAVGEHLREYTEAEQLCREDVVEERGYLRQGSIFRRAMTLKVLPEGGTSYLSAEPLVGMVEAAGDDVTPFAYWLSVSVTVENQGRSRLGLNTAHNLVGMLTDAVPFLRTKSAARDAENASKMAGIEGLFAELNAMASKIVGLSVTLLLEAPSLESLESRTETARAAFSRAGNSELHLEEVTQLPAFLSVLPGSGPYQLRKKVCTSRNAGDFLPTFAAWEGCTRASTLLWTPTRDVFRFDFFDPQLPAHHGLVWADTGSGKSVTLGAFTLDALAAGNDAILVDNGRSWERMVKLLGGIHVNVDIQTPITPFLPYAEMVTDKGEIDAESVEDVVTFLELCVRDADLLAFNKLTIRLVAAAVRHAYVSKFRAAPAERPLMSHFRDAIREIGRFTGRTPR